MYRRYAVEGSDGVDNGYGIFDYSQLAAQWGIFMSVVIFYVAQSATYPHIAQSFHEKRVAADLLKAETETETEPETETETDAETF
jgi:hypothetical protein